MCRALEQRTNERRGKGQKIERREEIRRDEGSAKDHRKENQRCEGAKALRIQGAPEVLLGRQVS
jgi:hypothetical protein